MGPQRRRRSSVPVAITLPPLPTATATPTAPGIELPPTSTPLAGGDGNGDLPPDSGIAAINARVIGQAFLAGVRLTVICFLLLAAYASLRAVLRLRPRPRRRRQSPPGQ